MVVVLDTSAWSVIAVQVINVQALVIVDVRIPVRSWNQSIFYEKSQWMQILIDRWSNGAILVSISINGSAPPVSN